MDSERYISAEDKEREKKLLSRTQEEHRRKGTALGAMVLRVRTLL